MQHEPGDEKKGGWKTWLWMAACCVPMIAIIVLIALGSWRSL
jgi:nitrate reductase NapE component